MALLPETFDIDGAQPSQPREVLPAAWYKAAAIESDVGPTKKSGGVRLKISFDIIEGPRKSRRIFTGFNLVNANPVAVQISKGELKSLCDAAGLVGALADSDALHGRSVDILLTIDPPSVDKKTGKQYGAKNEVAGYAAAGSRSNDPANIVLQGTVAEIQAAPASAGVASPAPPPAATGGSGAAPAPPAQSPATPVVPPANVAAPPAAGAPVDSMPWSAPATAPK